MDKSQISAERKQLIVKSNEVIQKSRYKLSTQQQKLILYMISKYALQIQNLNNIHLI